MRIEDFEAQIQPYKLALLEAFGLDPGKTSNNVSASSESATFKCVGLTSDELAGLRSKADVRWDLAIPGMTEIDFPARRWNDEQRLSVEAYCSQFPSFEDFPSEVRAVLRNSLKRS